MSLPLIDPNAEYDIHNNIIVPPSPQPSQDETAANPNRLCSDENHCGEGDAGCRRTDTILVFEAEFDTFVDAAMYWGARDQFFIHNGYMYFYKPLLQAGLDEDEANRKADAKNKDDKNVMKALKKLMPSFDPDTDTPNTLADIRALIDKKPKCLPMFVAETPHFYQFVSVGTAQLTAADMTKENLTTIKNTYTDFVPMPMTVHDSFYKNDTGIYWTDLLRLTSQQALIEKFHGVYVDQTFYPFDILTDEQNAALDVFGQIFVADANAETFVVKYCVEDSRAIAQAAQAKFTQQ
jgi:hypothetical protein